MNQKNKGLLNLNPLNFAVTMRLKLNGKLKIFDKNSIYLGGVFFYHYPPSG